MPDFSIAEWIGIFNLIGPIAGMVLIAYARKHFVTRAELLPVKQKVDRVEETLTQLEAALARSATSDQVHKIELKVTEAVGEISTMGAHVESAVKLVDRIDGYLRNRDGGS